MSRLCHDQPVVLGDTAASASECIPSIARRVISSSNVKVKIGGTALLVCAAKVNHHRVVEDLNQSNSSTGLIQSLVTMLGSGVTSLAHPQDDTQDAISIRRHAKEEARNEESDLGTAVISGANLAIWLLSILACHDVKSKIAIMEAGAVEVVTERISQRSSQYAQVVTEVMVLILIYKQH